MLRIAALMTLALALLLAPANLLAHCDGLDGPVVKAAKRALDTGDLSHALIWVQKQDEPAIRSAFQHVLAVRKLGAEASHLAERYFFETLVRVHRAGEGAPYTGLKPAGRDLGPAIPAADEAVGTGAAETVHKLLTETIHHGLHRRFKEVLARKDFKAGDVDAGREYVRAYVEFLHYVERLYEAAKGPAGEHAPAAHALAEHAH